MRAGGCTIQKDLTTEAESVIKQAVTLARKRGHAQVTPLHVANTMLSSSTGLLRTACLQSHSHPLQCKALELCFNVALNRLPTSTSSPILGGQSPQQFPSISNALVAAFKRAQAHQRRGSVEYQQQPILALKIELEQLILSILDDPSVSRVMKEAGFSSTQLKGNVEQAVSLEVCSQSAPSSVTSKSSKETTNALVLSNQSLTCSTQVGAKVSKPNKEINLDPIRNEDVMSVIENLASNTRRGFVIVGECLSIIEGVVKGVMEKVQKGDVPETLRELKFLSVPVSSFGNISKIEVEQKMEELKGLVRSHMGKGLILNLGDLKLVIEHTVNHTRLIEEGSSWSSVEHLILELGKFSCTFAEKNSGNFWLMGIATFKSYKKCKTGHSLLDTVCGLHPLTIPAVILRLSLITDSEQLEAQSTSSNIENGSSNWFPLGGVEEKQLSCCPDCSAKFENEARSLQSSSSNGSNSITSTLPAWLQQYKKGKDLSHNDHQDGISIKDLCKKWNALCSSIHQQPEKTFSFYSVSTSYSSTSSFSCEQQHSILNQTNHDNHCWTRSESFHAGNINKPPLSLRLHFPECQDHFKQQILSPNRNSVPYSTHCSDAMEMDYSHNFKELSSNNLKIICDSLEKKVPWQKDIIPEIASTILKCRSGMMRRKGKESRSRSITAEAKEETWFFFQGVDVEAKEKIAKELARLVFGSHDNFVSISLSNFSSTRADSTEESRNKRTRDEQNSSYIEKFAEAISSNPHRVFLVEDVEQVDYNSQMGFKRATERGKVSSANGEAGLGDAIIILSCESFSSRSRACSPSAKLKTGGLTDDEEKEVGVPLEVVSLDLNISIEEDGAEDQSIDDIGLLESVDKRIMFRIQGL